MSNFRVGQKVVCVDDQPGSPCWTSQVQWCGSIKRGEVYTIRWTGVYETLLQGDHYCVRLQEVDRRDFRPGYEDTPFAASRFRPIVERKTDISVFTEMLNSKKTPAKAGA